MKGRSFDKDKDILVYDLSYYPRRNSCGKGSRDYEETIIFLLFDSTTGGKSPYIIKDGKEQYGNKEDN